MPTPKAARPSARADEANLPALQKADPVGRMLWNAHGFAITRVDPKAFNKKNLADVGEVEAGVIEMLARDGYKDVQAALQGLVGTFGIAAYADKRALADSGEAFYVGDIVQRIGGGFKEDDDWALNVTMVETGEQQVLTLESNPGRDRFLYTLAFAKTRFPDQAPLCCLAFIPTKAKGEGTGFYILGSARIGTNNLKLANRENPPDPEQTTFEGEVV